MLSFPWKNKRWHYVACVSDALIISAVIADFGYLGYAFAYAYLRHRKELVVHKIMLPAGIGVHVPKSSEKGTSILLLPQKRIIISKSRNSFSLKFPDFSAKISFTPANAFISSWSIPNRGIHKTSKEVGGKANGSVTVKGLTIPFHGHSMIDWSMGRPSRETSWKWVCGVGNVGNTVIGWNLRIGFDDESQAENVIWVDGIPQHVESATITTGDVWKISTKELDLTFYPDGKHEENLDLILLGSKYQQPWGCFEGTWKGKQINGYGVVEDHWAKW